MTKQTEARIATALLIACAVVVVIYLLPRPVEPPAKVWFDTRGGHLIYDHAFHASMIACRDCHHNLPAGATADETAPMNCRACHYYDRAVQVATADPHPRAIGARCVECHSHLGEALARCDACHLHLGYAFIASARYKRPFPEFVVFAAADSVAVDSPGTVVFDHAYHKDIGQCLRCHHEYDSQATGVHPGEKNCRRCHHDAAIVPADGEMPHALFIGDNCLSTCHAELGTAMSDCETCHLEPQADPRIRMVHLPRPPRKVAYETEMGTVVFDHQQHHYDSVRIACTACHHEPLVRPGLEDVAASKQCRVCHHERQHLVPELPSDGIHPNPIGNSCTGCHAVDDCALCHRD